MAIVIIIIFNGTWNYVNQRQRMIEFVEIRFEYFGVENEQKKYNIVVIVTHSIVHWKCVRLRFTIQFDLCVVKSINFPRVWRILQIRSTHIMNENAWHTTQTDRHTHVHSSFNTCFNEERLAKRKMKKKIIHTSSPSSPLLPRLTVNDKCKSHQALQ